MCLLLLNHHPLDGQEVRVEERLDYHEGWDVTHGRPIEALSKTNLNENSGPAGGI